MANKITARWTLKTQGGIESLQYEVKAELPELGQEDVLVEMHAASLNYRDLMIAKGAPGLPIIPNIISGSDGSGIVLTTGSLVTSFHPGDKVCTHMVPFIAEGDWPTFSHITTGVGEQVNGTLCEYGIFHHSCLVPMPRNLDFKQAATLTCSALTAWNALFGLKGRELKKGDWVLTQGTGGVSIAALQFAVAAGATVVATTSNEEKAQRLRELGATHVINYKSDPSWGKMAKSLTPDGRGIDYVVDVGGNNTLAESLEAVRVDGVVLAAGLVAGPGETRPALLDTLWKLCIVRGVLLGTRRQFRDMNRFIEEHNVTPAVDDEIFSLADTRGAYKKLESQKHFSKVVINIR